MAAIHRASEIGRHPCPLGLMNKEAQKSREWVETMFWKFTVVPYPQKVGEAVLKELKDPESAKIIQGIKSEHLQNTRWPHI